MQELNFTDILTLLQLVDKHISFLERDKERNSRSVVMFQDLRSKLAKVLATYQTPTI